MHKKYFVAFLLLSCGFSRIFAATISVKEYRTPGPVTAQEEKIIAHVKSSISKAERHQSNLIDPILKIHGYSGQKTRHFLNNVCRFEDAVYLEVGSWKGSTLVSALYANELYLSQAFCMENWSELGNHRSEFFSNVQTFIPEAPLQVIEQNCFDVDHTRIIDDPVTIYFYDGNHSCDSQISAFTQLNDLFAETFIAIVDDWNWGDVRSGTSIAFQRLGYKVLYEKQFLTDGNGDPEGWWNGFYIAVVRK